MSPAACARPQSAARSFAGWILAIAVANGALLLGVQGQEIKANNHTDLDVGSSWVGGHVPGDFATVLWDHTVLGPNTVTATNQVSWGGVVVADPGGDVQINARVRINNGFIDMGNATANLTFNSYLDFQTFTMNATVAAGRSLTFNGVTNFNISGGSDRIFYKYGAGDLVLTHDTGLGDQFHVVEGRVLIRDNRALTTATVYLNTGGGTLDFGNLTNVYVAALRGDQDLALINNAGQPITLRIFPRSSLSSQTNYSGVLSGDGASVIFEGGFSPVSAILTANNTYTGSTTLTYGPHIEFSSLNNFGLGDSIIFAASGGTLIYAPGNNADLSVRTVTINGSAVINTNGNDVSFANAVGNGGEGDFSKAGNGTLTFATANTYTGLTYAAGGNLVLGVADALQGDAYLSGGNLVIRNGDALRMRTVDSLNSPDTGRLIFENITDIALGSVSGGMDLVLVNNLGASVNATIGTNNVTHGLSGNISGSGSLTFVGTGTQTIDGVISGISALTKTGAGTLVLNGNNSFSSAIDIQAGTLTFAVNGLGATPALTLNGATLQYANNNTRDVSGILNIGSAGATINTGSNNVSFDSTFGNIGSGALVKAGTGNLTLNAANAYAGGTVLNAGRLHLGNASSLGSGNVLINGGTLNNTSGAAMTLLTNNNFTINATFSFAGTHDLNLGTGNITLVGNRTVTVSAGNLTIGGVIGGNNSLTKNGGGILNLNAANTYTGNTSITGGTLRLNNPNALQFSTVLFNNASGSLSFGNVTTVVLGALSGNRNKAISNVAGDLVDLYVGGNNRSTTYSGAFSNGGSLTKLGTGSLTLSGNNVYTGITTVAAGTLIVSNNGTISATGSGNIAVSAGAALGGGGLVQGNTTIAGAVTPGNAGAAGLLSFGNDLVLHNGASANFLVGGLARGTQYSAINVNGSLNAGGDLSLTLINGFSPVLGNVFDLFQVSDNIIGVFNALLLPNLGLNLTWDVSGLYTSGDIATAVPTFTDWTGSLGLSGNNALADAQPYPDRLPNLARYAMNLDTAPGAAEWPTPAGMNVAGTNYLAMQYRQRKQMPAVQIVPQYSTNLTNWSDVDPADITQLADDDVYTSRYEAKVGMTGSGPIFLRLNILNPP